MNFLKRLILAPASLLAGRSPFWMGVLILLFLPACTGAIITPYTIPEQVTKLESDNPKSIGLLTQSAGAFSPAGHQYLLFAIPFGRIEVQQPATSLFNKLYTNLLIRGYRVNRSGAANKKALLVTLTYNQLSAYDLLFMRRLYCKIELKIDLFGSDNLVRHSRVIVTEKSSYKAMAFQRELEHLYGKCLDEAVNKALNEIY